MLGVRYALCGAVLSLWMLIGFTGCTTAKPIPKTQKINAALAPSTIAIEDNIAEQHKILLAFAKAYPDKFSAVEFQDNDWTMVVNGARFYYAHGRFLPESLRGQWSDYLPYDFYLYPWVGTNSQRKAAYEYPLYSIGSSFLFDALYASPTEDTGWDWQEKYSFLGVKMLIHPYIKPMLDRVADQIRAAAQTDSSVRKWIAELQTSPPGGWNWRSIAGTSRRSNHSYGTAVDLLPKELNGRRTYWRWDINNPTIAPIFTCRRTPLSRLSRTMVLFGAANGI